MQNKKGQFWYGDFLIGLFILMVISVVFVVTITDINAREDVLQSLIDDGTTISNSLMSQGYLTAEEWKLEEGRIGFVEDGKVNNEKLAYFATIATFDYRTSQYLLGTRNNYAVYFEDKDGQIIDDAMYGRVNSLQELNNLGVENLVRFTRFVYYDNDNDGDGEIVKLILLIWETDIITITNELTCQRAENTQIGQTNLCYPLFILYEEYARSCCREYEAGYCCSVLT